MRVPFTESVSVALNGSGNGTASVGPLSAREVWYPSSVHVQVSSDGLESVCNLYVGPTTDKQYFRDATASGSLGDSSDRVSGMTVRNPAKVWAVWTGGDPLASATMTVVGEKDI